MVIRLPKKEMVLPSGMTSSVVILEESPEFGGLSGRTVSELFSVFALNQLSFVLKLLA